jgi:predicted nuclease of predicted toxin-antitoxin system
MAGRLLFDENLSPRLPGVVADGFPGSVHVRDVGLKGATDEEIWTFAGKNGFTIVTKDDDFRGLSLLRGAPPKVIWLLIGNTSTQEIRRILLSNTEGIATFISEPVTSLLRLRTV